MGKASRILLFASLVVFALGCEHPLNSEELSSLISDPNYGLCHVKDVGDKTITVKYLLPEYLALKDARDNTTNYESALSQYDQNLSFLITYAFSGINSNLDLLKGSVDSYEEYSALQQELVFNYSRYVTLNVNSFSYKPVLSHMEDAYGLQPHRSIIVVFSPDSNDTEISQKDVELIIEDEIFGTGINHFLFKSEHLFKKYKVEYPTFKNA